MNVFSNVIVHNLECSQDATGEYGTICKVDFMLTEKIEFEVAGVKHTINKICMHEWESWGDELSFTYANESRLFNGLTIAKPILRALYKKLLKEQRTGVLKGWCFDEELSDLYNDSASMIRLI